MVYLTSKTLIDSVRRRCSLPKSDSMFSDEDLLAFANDEIMDSIVPLIKSNQEEYLVWNTTVPLTSTNHYPIPERAVGNALRDLCFVDTNQNQYEMTRITRDDRYESQYISSYSQPYRYYMENADIVLSGAGLVDPTGFLRFSYLIRPNQLVLSENVVKITTISEGFVPITNITTGTTTTIVTPNPHNVSVGETVLLNSVVGDSSINDTHTVTEVINNNSFKINFDSSALGAFTNGIVYNNTKTIALDKTPSMFSIDEKVDFIKSRSPHNILMIDQDILQINIVQNTLTFKNIPSQLQKGDTIANSQQTDIPNIPTEMHRVLVNKVCERVMESVGDQAGYQIANRKATESMGAMNELIDNRVTSAPLKLKKRHGFLTNRQSRNRRF